MLIGSLESEEETGGRGVGTSIATARGVFSEQEAQGQIASKRNVKELLKGINFPVQQRQSQSSLCKSWGEERRERIHGRLL
jgi:hypothetical protein